MREQYADASRLDARIYERFSTSRESWPEWLLARLALVAGERVLDAGAGSGRLWRESAGRLPERVRVALEIAREGALSVGVAVGAVELAR